MNTCPWLAGSNIQFKEQEYEIKTRISLFLVSRIYSAIFLESRKEYCKNTQGFCLRRYNDEN